MKKIIFILPAVLIMLASCDKLAKETDAYKQMKYSKDSIQAIQERTVAEMDEYLSIIQDVDSGFEAIRQSENYLSLTSYNDGMPSEEIKQRMADNMYMINSILADNKAKIAELEKKLKSSSLNSTQLKKNIERLTEELKEKSMEIESLRAELEQKNIKIDSLVLENQMLEDQAVQFAAEMERQSQELQEQDRALNAAYYLLADKKTLKENNIDAKNMSSAFRTSLFTTVDVRELQVLQTKSKSAKVLTKHPATSYTLEKDENREYVLVIKNATDFWSTSKYLIIRVD